VVRIDDVVALFEHALGGLELDLGAFLYRVFGYICYFGNVSSLVRDGSNGPSAL
jgi:hypothetical protein